MKAKRIRSAQKKPAVELPQIDKATGQFRHTKAHGFVERPKTGWDRWKKHWFMWYMFGVATSPLYLLIVMRFVTGSWPSLLQF